MTCSGEWKKVILSENVLFDGSGRWTHTAESVKEDLGSSLRVEEGLDSVEVKDLLEEDNVVGRRVDDLDLERSDGDSADLFEVDLGQVDRLVGRDGLGDLVDGLGDVLGGRASKEYYPKLSVS